MSIITSRAISFRRMVGIVPAFACLLHIVPASAADWPAEYALADVSYGVGRLPIPDGHTAARSRESAMSANGWIACTVRLDGDDVAAGTVMRRDPTTGSWIDIGIPAGPFPFHHAKMDIRVNNQGTVAVTLNDTSINTDDQEVMAWRRVGDSAWTAATANNTCSQAWRVEHNGDRFLAGKASSVGGFPQAGVWSDSGVFTSVQSRVGGIGGNVDVISGNQALVIWVANNTDATNEKYNWSIISDISTGSPTVTKILATATPNVSKSVPLPEGGTASVKEVHDSYMAGSHFYFSSHPTDGADDPSVIVKVPLASVTTFSGATAIPRPRITDACMKLRGANSSGVVVGEAGSFTASTTTLDDASRIAFVYTPGTDSRNLNDLTGNVGFTQGYVSDVAEDGAMLNGPNLNIPVGNVDISGIDLSVGPTDSTAVVRLTRSGTSTLWPLEVNLTLPSGVTTAYSPATIPAGAATLDVVLTVARNSTGNKSITVAAPTIPGQFYDQAHRAYNRGSTTAVTVVNTNAAGALAYQRLPVRVLTEKQTPASSGTSPDIDLSALSITGYASLQVDNVQISRDGWMAVLLVDGSDTDHTVLRRNPTTGVWTNLGKPTDGTAIAKYADGQDAEIALSPGGWVSLIYWPDASLYPACRLYGPSASGWSTKTVSGSDLIVEHFDQSQASALGIAWRGDSAATATTIVASSYSYAPETDTATLLATSLPYNGTTYPRGVLAGRIYGNRIAGILIETIDPTFVADPFTATIGTPADFNAIAVMPTPPVVPGADWATGDSGWEYAAISATGVLFDISDGNGFSACAYRAHGSTAAPTLIVPPAPFNGVYAGRDSDLADGGFFMTVVQRDATGDWIDGFSAKWLPGTGFIDLESGNILTDQGSGRPDGSALDGAWLASGWNYNNGLNDVVESPVVWLATPTVSKSVGSTATEGGSAASATFTRTGSTLFPLTVKFTLSSSVDLAPSGLSEVSGSYAITIPRGESSASVDLVATNDNFVEANESVDVTLVDGIDDASVGNDRNAGLYAYDHSETPSTVTVISEDVTANPTTTISRIGGSGTVKIGETATIQVVFSMAVTGFVDGELTVSPSTGSLGSLSSSNGGTTYTAVWTPTNGVDASAVTFGVDAGVAQTGTGANLVATGLSVNFDTLAPSAPTITAPVDGATIGANPTVTGTVPSGATAISVTAASTIQAASISGGWTTSFTGLAGGSTTISATADDAAGNTSSATSITVTVDATPPNLTVGTITSPTADPTVAVSGTVDETVELTIRDSATVVHTAASVPATNWGPLETSTLADGPHSLTVRAVDSLGNTTTSTAQVVTVDTTGPTVTLGSPSSLTVNSTATPTIIVTYADMTTAVTAITLANGDVQVAQTGTAATAAVSGSGTASRTITLSGLTGDGTITVQVVNTGTAVDTVGNNASISAISAVITVDNTAPAVAITTPTTTTNDQTPTIVGTAEVGRTVELREGGTLLGSAVATSGTWSIDTTTLGAGVHTLVATTVDAAGNVGTSATVDVTIDLTPPAVAITTIAGATNDTTPTITGTAETGATVQLREGATVLGSVVASGGTWSITSSALAEGVHNLTAQATDPAGNVATTSAVAITIDTTAPSIAFATPSATANVNADDTVTIVVTYSDAGSGLGTITLADGDLNVTTLTGSATATAVVSGSGATRTITLTGMTGDGSITVGLDAGTATDAAGNSAAVAGPSATITVDNTAPTVAITTPTTITADPTPTISGTSDDNGATIELRDGTTVLGSGTVSSGTWSIAPATALAAGTYSLTARGTDLAGNTGANSGAVSITINLSGPTVTISAGTISGTTATFTATFSAAVTGLVPGDIIVGGTAGGTKTVSISANAANTVYTITVSGLAAPSGTVTVQIPADVAAAVTGGDPSQGSSTATVSFTVPTGGTSGSSGGSSGGGGCGAGGLIGLIAIGALVGLRSRRRR